MNCRTLSLFFWWGLVLGCLADGSLISQQSIKPLEIPRQTAVITHAAGVETLTIWNTVQADAGSMAWVLPLPAVPEVIQQTHPAAVRLLQMVASPVVKSSRFDRVSTISAAGILAVGISFLVVRRPRKSLGQGCALVAAIPLICIFTAAAVERYSPYIPSRSMEVSAAVGVRLLASQDVGNYETSIVSGDSAERLNAWLSTNGFRAFTGRQAEAVNHYIAQKWGLSLCQAQGSGGGLDGGPSADGALRQPPASLSHAADGGFGFRHSAGGFIYGGKNTCEGFHVQIGTNRHHQHDAENDEIGWQSWGGFHRPHCRPPRTKPTGPPRSWMVGRFRFLRAGCLQ